MFKKIILFLLFSTLTPTTKLLVLFPEADLLPNSDITIENIEKVYSLLINEFKNNENVLLVKHQEKHFCYSKECAINLMNNYNADEVVTSKIRILNSKIVLTGMVLYQGGNKEFTVRSTAMSFIQLENSIKDLTKSLIAKDNKMKIPDVKDIIDKKGEQVKNSFFGFQNMLKADKEYRVGLGYSSYGVSGDGYKFDVYVLDELIGNESSSTLNKIKIINSWHFNKGKFLNIDFFLNLSDNVIGYGFEIISNKYLSISSLDSETTPIFYGFGGGGQFSSTNRSEGGGAFLSTQIGYNAFKAKSVNFLFTLKYQAEFMFGMNYKSDESNVSLFHQGISLNLALTSKIASKKDN